MTPPDTISDARRQLLEKLRRGEWQLSHRVRPLVPRPRGSLMPISPEQEQIWFHSRLAGNVPTYNESVTIHKRGPLDPLILERCFNEIIRRHEIWRSAFPMCDGKIVQSVDSNVQVRLPVIDLSNLSFDEREREAIRLASEDARRQFDLNVAPLFRLLLVRCAEDYHRIYLTLHHLVFDGVSIYRVFVRELADLYKAYSASEPSPLPELAFQYSDYSFFRHGQVADYDRVGQMNYWREALSGDLPSLQLPSHRQRPGDPTWHGEMERFAIPLPIVESLKELARTDGVTPYITLLAIFQVLLYRYSGQDEIVVGGATSTRTRPEFEPLIGYFLNTVVFRSRVSANLSFRDFLGYVKGIVLGALANSDIPFSTIVRELASKRDRGSHPLFQVLFMMRPGSGDFPDGWDITDMEVHTGASSFDLFLDVAEHPNGFAGRIVYSTDLFDRPAIQRLLGHFQVLLQELLADPDQAISRVKFLTEGERHQLLVDWNATERSYPQDRCVHQLFEQQATQTPASVAGICGNQQLTYRQLNERSTQLANHLQKLGVKPNDLVGICVERSLEMLVGLFGILKAGAGYVPLDPAYPTDRLAFMLEDCKPRLLLTQRKLQKRVPQCQAQIVCLDALVAETTGRECQQRQPHTNWQNDLAYVLYTSGSTGRPKGVQIPHRALVNFLAAMKRKPGISAADTLLAVTTLSFDIAGLELFLPLLAGARVIIASREDVANGATLSSLIKRYGVTVMQATPSTWRLLLAAGWGGDRHLKILCGGEAWSAELAEQLLPRCESLWNMYGPTETTIWSSANRVEAGKPVVIGMPIDNTAFYVLDAFQSLVPVGLPGELYIGGDGIARGYLNQTQLTKQRFIDDPFSRKPEAKLYRTGDIVRRLSDGTIEFLNRIDHQVKIRGFRIELGEVESALKQHSAIAQCVVLARENVPGDKRLAAYVVPHGSKVAPPAQELRDFLKQKLPDYMIPSAFVLLRELPLTPNGKVDRKALPLTPDECSSARQIMPPRTAWEFRLLRIWEQVLRIEIASVRDDFFDLGGHSLLAVELFAQIEKEFRTRLPLSTLYQAPTIEDLARILSGEAESPGWSSIIPIQPFGSRPPFFCFHGAGGNVLIYRKLAKYLGSDQPFYGLQARGLDGQSPPATTIEEMAAEYIKEIRFVQPQGPYFLGGYCMGGTVAYEVAQQLRAAGEEIALLALMDTMNWHKVVLNTWTGVFLRLQRLVFHATVTLKMDFESRRKFLEGKYNDLRNRIPVWRQILLTKMQKHAVRSTPSSFALAQVWQTNDYASRNYVPKSYPGVVTDFRPSRQYRLLNKAGLKWDRLATGGQRVVVVPGYPSFMLHEPYVKVLASMLRTCIDRASRSQKERARPRPELPIVRAS